MSPNAGSFNINPLRLLLMSFFLRLVAKLPLPTNTRLMWQRSLLDRAFAHNIDAARKLNDREKVESLESDHRFEINLHDEKEDAYLTRQLLAKARHLQLPVPHQYNDDKTESDHWYEGRLSSRWYLTRRGIASLREEIRRELKARQETRAQWFVWLSALTGLVGTITGLVALLIHKSP
jgi:hypothetical protein